MTVLIVDDEPAALQAIRSAVPWAEIGVGQVLEASNGKEAVEVLQQHAVEIMVCDLEMPQMGGISLLEWVHQQQMPIETIILTCHASFSAAQKAILLGSAAYLLKPVAPQELTAAVQNAIAAWRQKDTARDTRQAWETSEDMRRTQYFNDILRRNILSNEASLTNGAAKYGLSLQASDSVRMLLVCIRDWEDADNERARGSIAYGIGNLAQELWSSSSKSWCTLLHPETDRLLLLAPAELPLDERQAIAEIERFCAEKLKVTVQCFYGGACAVASVTAQMQDLMQMCDRSQLADNSLSDLSFESKDKAWRRQQLHWKQLIEEKNAPAVQEELVQALNLVKQKSSLRAEYVAHLKDSLLAAAYAALQSCGLTADGLLEEEYTFCEDDLADTPTQFLAWSQWVLQRAETMLHGGNEGELVKRIEDYIVLHIHQDLNRERIATAVYLNPDYMARLFKKTTGQTLGEYIKKKRLELAKQLLSSTDFPVGDLALSLGYASFSHFAKVFREEEGMTPSEYRRNANQKIES